jgi:hypothetical protein
VSIPIPPIGMLNAENDERQLADTLKSSKYNRLVKTNEAKN